MSESSSSTELQSTSSSSSSSESGPGDTTLDEWEEFVREAGKQATFQRMALTVSETGARTASWVMGDTEYIEIQPTSAATVARYGARDIIVTHKVWVANDPNVREGDRMLYDGQYYVVKGVQNRRDLGRLWRVDVEESVLAESSSSST